MINPEIFNLPLDDFVSIPELERNEIIHLPNTANFAMILNLKGIQTYLIKGTIYGCFIFQTDDCLKFQWFGYHNSADLKFPQYIIPNSVLDFSTILTRCSSELLEGLLYYLDLISGG